MTEDGASTTLAAVIVAAGSGRRFAEEGPRKQYRPLRGRPLLSWAVAPFTAHPEISETVVVLPAEDVNSPPDWLARLPVRLVAGGAERGDSVRAGLEVLSGTTRVLIHDGARPFVTPELIDRVIASEARIGAIPALPVTDTLKEVDCGHLVVATVPRERLWRVQTPQAFPMPLLLALHREAAAESVRTTDDAGLFEHYNQKVRIVEGDPLNLKITTAFDLALAEQVAVHMSRIRPGVQPA